MISYYGSHDKPICLHVFIIHVKKSVKYMKCLFVLKETLL